MFIKKLYLKNFRNYEDQTFEFGEGVNVVTGDNAQGKTNCAEAVFLLATGYSPRVKKDRQVIRYGQDKAEISVDAQSNYGNVSVKLNIYEQGSKKIFINAF